MIDSNAFRRIRRRVMKERAPEFDEKKGTYRRETANSQLHCIEFGTWKWGGAFCVDVGVHFSDVPSFECFAPLRKPEHPQPLTCCLHRRWRDADNEQFSEYGESPDEAEQLLVTIVSDCLQLFAEIDTRWQDGRPLLEALPPKVMASDALIFQQLLNCPNLQERDRISDAMTIRQLFPGWFPHVSPMCVLLAYIADKFGRSKLVPEYIAITESPGQGHIMLPRASALVEQLPARAQNEG